MNKVLMALVRRDLHKVFSLRTILIWGALSFIAIFFLYATSGKTVLLNENKVEYMALFLAQIIFGAWAVLSIYFDLISSDREQNVLDCVICSGISKPVIFSSKIITLFVASMILSFIYLTPVTTVAVFISSDPAHFFIIFKYFLPLWGYIMVYAALGITISVIARSTKVAMITCLALGLILMPRFYYMIVDGLGNVLNMSQSTKNIVGMISPGVMMDSMASYAGTADYYTIIFVFLTSILLLISLALFVFKGQDELNYGG